MWTPPSGCLAEPRGAPDGGGGLRPLNYFELDDYGVPTYYEGVFLASDEMIQNEPEVLPGLPAGLRPGASRT